MSNYLDYLEHEIHSVVLATADVNGNPITCVIDMTLADQDGLYFLTAKGKALYERLLQNENIALTGFKGEFFDLSVRPIFRESFLSGQR